MLALPPKGFRTSVQTHNVDRDILVDWIEGSVAFTARRVSKSDIVDILIEEGVYESQDFAFELLGDTWIELERRENCFCGNSPFVVDSDTVRRSALWTNYPCYSFCLLASIQIHYPEWAKKKVRPNYNTQGRLFEEIVDHSLAAAGWTTLRTGWSASKPGKIAKVVRRVADHLNETAAPDGIARWAGEELNEAGLDIVCSEPYPDEWGGRPLFLFQCASGKNWREKLKSPDLDLWKKIIDFSNPPQRGFATTLAFHGESFLKTCARVAGVLVDRTRVVASEGSWCPRPLSRDIRAWISPTLRKLNFILA